MEYEKLTVPKLKDELKSRGIPITNLKLKQQCIDRLVQDDSEKAQSQPASSPDQVLDPAQTHISDDQVLDEEPALPVDENKSPSLEHTTDPATDHAQPSDQDQVTTQDHAPPAHVSDSGPPSNSEPATPSQPEVQEAAADSSPKQIPVEPVSRATTPAAHAQQEPSSAEGKKRKRRSVTPPVSQHVVAKKLKQTDDSIVHLQREDEKDTLMTDAPLDQPDATVQPMAISDDVVELSAKDQDKSAVSRTTRSPNERRFKDLINAPDSASAAFVADSADITVSPALHSATRALYIRDLVRPINPAGLREHVEELARPPDYSSSDPSVIQDFWVDALRTHAFLLFTSISAASRARAGIHARVWPPEPTRKPLWADFFPEEQLNEWIETERASGGSRPSQAKRWEVAYDVSEDRVDVSLVEAGHGGQRPSTQSGPINPPTGPRNSVSSARRPSFPQGGEFRRPSQPMPRRPSARAVEEASAPFLELDKLFKFTNTKPKLYWQPVSDDLADDRLDELDRETSRDWDPKRDGRENGDSLGRGLDQLKRYTFEDGDVLVDGGPEFGGGRAFARNSNRGGGRGSRRGADTYRRG